MCTAELESGLRSKPSFEAARIEYSNGPGKAGNPIGGILRIGRVMAD
jgi:hypothetical protein